MPAKTASDAVDTIRSLMDERKLKLSDMAKDIGIPYRSLQNYMYKRSAIPLDVYIKACRWIGITADYAYDDKFKLTHHALQSAITNVFGEDFLNQVEFDKQLNWTLVPGCEFDQLRVRRVASAFAVLLAGRYDVWCEVNLRSAGSDDDPEAD